VSSLTRWVLAHKGLVVIGWIVLAIAGIAAAGPASKALKAEFSVPDKESWETNVEIAQLYGSDRNRTVPLIPVVTLPDGKTVRSPGVPAELSRVDERLRVALPGAPIASYSSTGSDAFVSKDGRTAFALVFPRADPSSTFGENSKAEKAARAAIAGSEVAGAPVHRTGFDALANESGGSGGPGVLLEALIGGFGALLVLAFVFGSLLALVPMVIAVVSIMTTFLLLYGLTQLTAVSPIVQYLIALIGLGVAIDYSLLVVSRWREERSHGRTGDQAVQRAMEIAGRAVIFSGITVGIGLLALMALPLPFLRSMATQGADPAGLDPRGDHAAPGRAGKVGRRLDWSHLRTDDKASRAWTRWATAVTRRRWLAAGTGLCIALALAATQLRLGVSDADTMARSGDAKQGLTALERAGIGEGALLPHEILVTITRAGT
jgi:putative drug exporter of the RND superfamily